MTWSIRETRIVEPYLTDHGALSKTELRLAPDENFDTPLKRWIDPNAKGVALEPELRIRVDEKRLRRRTQLSPADLALHVVLRDRATRWWSLLETWPLEEIPETYRIIHPQDQNALGIKTEIGVLVSPAKVLENEAGLASRPDEVVARTDFLIAQEIDGTRFNVQTQPPEWFEEKQLPGDTVWTVHWFSLNVYQPPIDALSVVVNEKYFDSVSKLLSHSRGSAWASHQLAIEVFTEVALMTLRQSDDYIDEPASVFDVVCNQLNIDSDESFRAFKQVLDLPPKGITAASMIRSRIQSNIKLHKHLRDLGLEAAR